MITSTTWGYQDVVTQGSYCGSQLFLKEQYRCGYTQSESKDSVFVILDGLVYVESGPDFTTLIGSFLSPGDRIKMPPGTIYRFSAVEDSVLSEMSNIIEPLKAGGKISDEEYRGLLATYFKQQAADRSIVPDSARTIATCLKAEGHSVGLCHGVFDLMHLGHIEFLRQARLKCERLFVAVNTDTSAMALKGISPVVDEVGRMGMVESCRYVDFVIEHDSSSAVALIESVRPNIYFTSFKYGNDTPEAKAALACGAFVEVLPTTNGYSTTGIRKTLARRR